MNVVVREPQTRVLPPLNGKQRFSGHGLTSIVGADAVRLCVASEGLVGVPPEQAASTSVLATTNAAELGMDIKGSSGLGQGCMPLSGVRGKHPLSPPSRLRLRTVRAHGGPI